MVIRYKMLLLCVLTASSLLFIAQAAVGADKSLPAKKLALKQVGGLANGRIAYVKGQTAQKELRYYASNLLATQPVLVTVKADDPKDDLHVRITKTQWSTSEREGSTGDAGHIQFAFRTQREFGLGITGADAGIPFRMTVWVGDEVKRPMPAVVVPKSTWQPGKMVKSMATASDSPASAVAANSAGAKPMEKALPSSNNGVSTTASPAGVSGIGAWGFWLVVGLLVFIVGLLIALLRNKKER